ncbi:MAG: Type secretion system pilin [Candidatus Parcubacteria bacterium]|jgi:hypothetical protein
MKKMSQYIVGTLAILLTGTNHVLADALGRETAPTSGSGGVEIVQLKNPIAADSVNELIGNIIDILLLLAAPVLVCVFIWIGLRFVLAQGNATKLKEVRQAFLWTLVGAAIVIGAKGIQILVTGTFEAII